MSMRDQYFVRYGVMGQLAPFLTPKPQVYQRSAQVVLQTQRGLELGEILSSTEALESESGGMILRSVTPADQLLARRIEGNKNEAFAACQTKLADLNTQATLIDIELLFDGRSLFFYFLGEMPAQIESLSAELAEVYDAKVKFRQFTEAVTNGCGPHCGSEDASGGCDNCTSCTIATACSRSSGSS
jgi:cell fate regulator YaaT (PSP1 superfamily)